MRTFTFAFDAREALLTLGVCAAAALGGLAAVLAAGSGPRDSSRVAAVFPPWWSAQRALGAALGAGEVAAMGGWPSVVIVQGDPHRLEGRLRRAGAVLFLDPLNAGGCANAQRAAP